MWGGERECVCGIHSMAASLPCSVPALSCSQRWRRPRTAAAAPTDPATTTTPTLLGGPFLEGRLKQPRYTGDHTLSRLLTALISIKPFFALMKAGARRVFISTAEKKGIPWREMSETILASDVYAHKELVENASVVYPDYYLQEFHAYEEGNLSWKAAAEAEAATMSMASRAIPSASTAEEASHILRENWLEAIKQHHRENSGDLGISDILDVGCSIGISSRTLAEKFPSAHVTGLDLSPYFLAVAKYNEEHLAAKGNKREREIRWVHANGEDTGLPSASFDIVSFSYVIHECPEKATRQLLKEAFRLLRPRGTIALTDNSPKSKVIQSLPPVLFTLMKSTEPWMDEYYSFDLESAMSEVGFVNVKSILTDPRHRTATGTVPSQT